MGQVTIYLDKNIEQKMNIAAQAANLSKSKWIAQLIQQKLNDEWPQSVVALAGAWQDFPDIEEIRNYQATDIKRETL
jgi:predicted transcriptional regulator